MSLRWRHEWKFALSSGEALVLRARLRAVLRPDPHGGPDHRYEVRSLYWDDPLGSSLADKLTGLVPRAKWRIRTYGTGDAVVLERKRRGGDGRVGKERAPVHRDEVERWLAGEVPPLADGVVGAFLRQVHHRALRPSVVVSYVREAYTAPLGEVRVTLDHGLTASMRGLFGDRFAPLPVAVGTMLEVKFDVAPPAHVLALLPPTVAPRAPISKLALCRQRLPLPSPVAA